MWQYKNIIGLMVVCAGLSWFFVPAQIEKMQEPIPVVEGIVRHTPWEYPDTFTKDEFIINIKTDVCVSISSRGLYGSVGR